MTEKKRTKLIRFLGYAIPILFVVYVLSIGPVFAIVTPRVSNDSGFYKGFRTFYAPLYSCARRNQFLSTQLKRYILLCEYFINPPPKNLRPQVSQ